MRGTVLEALRDRIFAALARGDEAAAIRDIEELRPHAPAEAAGLLTALHIEAGRAQEALAAWAECERCAPHDPYTVFLRARIALLDGERHAALDLLLRDQRDIRRYVADRRLAAACRDDDIVQRVGLHCLLRICRRCSTAHSNGERARNESAEY